MRAGSIAAALAAILTAAAPAAGASLQSVLEGCVPCHGADGVARDSEVPHLAGQNELYLANQLRAFRSGERIHPEMAYMSSDLDDDTISALAAFYAELPPWR